MPPFSLPIALLKNKTSLEPELVSDLELISSIGDGQPLYSHVFGPSKGLGQRTFDKWSQYYTSDRRHIKDCQRLLKRSLPAPLATKDEKDIEEVWSMLARRKAAGQDVDGFHSTYQYIDWDKLKWLNSSPAFLTCLSAYNIGSPLISLATPIFIMLVPFVLLKVKGLNVSIKNYLQVLRVAMRGHALGKLFDLGSATTEQRMYIAVSIAFYAFQVYQNVRSCIQFCRNTSTVRLHVQTVKAFLRAWIDRASSFEKRTRGLKSFSPFVGATRQQVEKARRFFAELPTLDPTDSWRARAVGIGSEMKAFYMIHQDAELREVLGYGLDWCGYIENLREVKRRLAEGAMHACKLSKTSTAFCGARFPASGPDPVKNSYRLDKHLLVTGPNAAGKTTILKATLFNVLLSQQLGVGFYDRARIAPYDRIHCYINIPDTGGRDSLFQAEARRCRNILASIDETPVDSRHFCVFDELYSGTNPYEAVGSAEAFLRYIGDSSRVSFIMTTHFLDLCSRLDDHQRVSNCHMAAECGDKGMQYTYKLMPGVSTIKGGVEVLKALSYPDSVVKAARCTVESLSI